MLQDRSGSPAQGRANSRTQNFRGIVNCGDVAWRVSGSPRGTQRWTGLQSQHHRPNGALLQHNYIPNQHHPNWKLFNSYTECGPSGVLQHWTLPILHYYGQSKQELKALNVVNKWISLQDVFVFNSTPS